MAKGSLIDDIRIQHIFYTTSHVMQRGEYHWHQQGEFWVIRAFTSAITLTLPEQAPIHVTPGEGVLLPPMSPRAITFAAEADRQVEFVTLRAAAGNGFDFLQLIDFPPSLNAEQSRQVFAAAHCWLQARQDSTTYRLLAQARAREAAFRVLGLLLSWGTPRYAEETMSAMTERFREVLTYMQAHLDNPPSRQELARVAGLSPNRFATLFQSIFQQTPHQYFQRLRIARAQELLNATDYPLARIAEVLGFTDAFYFSRVFKQLTGVSPSAFRRAYPRR